jgi:lipopolysaccharide biosynthesis glycosyltransferase
VTDAPTVAPSRGGGDPRFGRAYLRVGRILLGREALPLPGTDVPFTPDLAGTVSLQARRARARARFAELLAEGVGLEEALLTAIRDLVAARDWRTARSLCEGLAGVQGAERARRLGRVLCAYLRERSQLVYAEMAAVDDEDLARFLPLEAVESCLVEGADPARARARAIAHHTDAMELVPLIGVAGRFLAVDDLTTTRTLAHAARRRDLTTLEPASLRQLEVIEEWLTERIPASVPEGTVSFGVIDYHQPDQTRASGNVGDYVQTLAMLGHLARFSGCRLTGPDGLEELLTTLQDRCRAELRLPEPTATAQLVVLNRDFSSHDAIPPTTWTIAFGWHMHSLFGIRYDFPYHPNVRPLFVSFHVNRPEMLSEEALEYLRRYGPVGCRDWTTVDLLLSAGVDAFFTGCLTTTVDAVFPHRDETGAHPEHVGLVDAPAGHARNLQRPTEVVTHSGLEHREASLTDGVHAALELLETYQRRYARLITSRLHAYLPATSLGIPVTFRPANPADVRFEGLLGMKPQGPQIRRMRNGIRELLAAALGPVLAGAGEDEVYARWRELTASRVEVARARLESAREKGLAPGDLTESIRQVLSEKRGYGAEQAVDAPGVTHVALGLDQNLKEQLPVTLEALVSNASGPLRLWITCRGLDAGYQQWLSSAFPDVPMTFLPCDHVEYGVTERMIEHVTVATMDRLLIPELLSDVPRVVYLDVDAIVVGDVCELARTDLRGHPLAARTSFNIAANVWRTAGLNLSAERAAELRRSMAARHPFSVRTFNAGVLVLDLDRMRADRFTPTFVPFAERYGFHDQDVLLAYAGGSRAELPPRWNAWPVIEVVEDPAIVHYLGPSKPWLPGRAPADEYWTTYAAAFARRVGGLESADPEAS